MQDEMKTALDAIEIPESSTGAAQRVVSQAKHMQQGGSGVLLRLRRFRAWFFQLHIRYVVMATVVMAFALIGRYGEYQKQQMEMAAIDPLDGVFFAIESWDEGAFVFAEDTPVSMDLSPFEGVEFDIENWANDIDWDV